VKHVLLFPILIAVFILDRVFLVFAFWVPSEKFETWLYKDELILESIHRVLIFLSSVSVIQLFTSLW
jgi:hypothetical protein